jgi:hypothetical protein
MLLKRGKQLLQAIRGKEETLGKSLRKKSRQPWVDKWLRAPEGWGTKFVAEMPEAGAPASSFPWGWLCFYNRGFISNSICLSSTDEIKLPPWESYFFASETL